MIRSASFKVFSTKKITTNSLAGSYASLEAILENSGCGIYVADMSKSEILYIE
mgnify:CR=1 FL=1